MTKFLALIFALAMTSNAFAQPADLKALHEKTDARLRDIVGKTRGVMGFSALDLSTGESFGINDDVVFPQASAIKVAILMEVYKQAGEGKFKLSDTRRIRREDKTGGSGILAELGDGTVEMSLHDLCVLMVVLSDNTATNMLIDLVGKQNVNRTLASLGLKETKLQRRMMDTAAAQRGEENFSTPAEAAHVMEILFKGEFLDRKSCEEILAILKKGKATNVKSGLPEDVVVASKPGGIPGVTTEWAIVYLKERPYVLTVMEKNGKGEAAGAFKEISKTLYEYFLQATKGQETK
jgi:beta-lactamase class A